MTIHFGWENVVYGLAFLGFYELGAWRQRIKFRKQREGDEL